MIEEAYTVLGDIINSEGPLLGVAISNQGKLNLNALSNTYKGYLSFEPRFKDLVSYIESNITLRELILISNAPLFSFDLNVEMKRIPLQHIINSLPYIDHYYKEIPRSLK